MAPDDLYGLPLDRFIPERAALAKALRADKQRDEAAAVAALRKPSVAAWAVNQLVRSQGAAVRDLFDAGDALRDAQSDLLAGRGDGRTLRAANERERAAVDTLVEAARGLLNSDGHELSPAVVERVSDTLHAAALDEDAREQVRAGRLERELRHVGLGLGESAAPAAPAASAAPAKAKAKAKTPPAPKRQTKDRAKPPAAKAGRAERAERERAVKEAREQAAAAERERAEARKAARTAEAQARRRAERSAHALRAAQERRERAAQALGEADEALSTAQAQAQEAADALAEARAQVEKL